MNIIRTFARKYELEIIVRKSGHQWKYGSEDSIIPCSQYLRNHWGGGTPYLQLLYGIP